MNKTQTRTLAAKRIAVAVAAVCATMSMPSTASDDVKVLLDLMLKKGVITQSDYDQFVKSTADSAEDKAFKEKRIEADVAKANKFVQQHEKDGSVKPSGLGWVSADGKNEINLTGRLHFDARQFSNGWGQTTDRDSGSNADRFSVRRARIGVTGVFNKDFTYEMVTNLTGATTNTGATNSTAVVDTAWVNYMITPEAQWRFGRMKTPFAMETLQSSNNIDFMERSYLDQLAPGKQNGAMFHGEKDGVVYAVSGWQNGYDPITNSNGLAPQFGGRVATNLANAFAGAGDAILHVGLAGMVGKQEVTPVTSSQKGNSYETKGAFIVFRDENQGLSPVFRDRIYGGCPYNTPKAGGGSTYPDCTAGTVPLGYSLPAQDAAQVDKLMGAFEAAYATGPLKVQYEYADAKLTAKSHAQNAAGTSNWATESSGHAKVQYLSFLYNVTGEDWKDSYKSGLFGSVKPKSSYNIKDGSGTGAWQVGLRISQYDASDFGTTTNGTLPADEETTGANGKKTCGGNTYYQLGGSPKGTTYTLGVNWILNPNARVMLNYSHTDFGNSFYPIDTGTVNSNTKATSRSDVISLRTQFNF
jgi:phosphate-selective porin OprO/OprP